MVIVLCRHIHSVLLSAKPPNSGTLMLACEDNCLWAPFCWSEGKITEALLAYFSLSSLTLILTSSFCVCARGCVHVCVYEWNPALDVCLNDVALTSCLPSPPSAESGQNTGPQIHLRDVNIVFLPFMLWQRWTPETTDEGQDKQKL